LVDDHPDFRRSLRDLVGATERLEVAGEADCGQQAILLAWACRPDVALIDYQMPGMDGIDTSLEIKAIRPSLRIVLVSATSPDELPREAHHVVDAVVSKDAVTPRVLDHLWEDLALR
jgi:DNA-binding NarL/FixJ family response regulator